ncbi:MAG: ArdC-like ssDNA-binding domain-containing protein [Actinomycetota bacterium]|jgi:hypothetical protein|nr:ArdC-like ssDNA-binding domain-containing protein [Actinomycetota bacterium]
MSTTSAIRHRQPAGVPVGGQFATKSNPESDLDLDIAPVAGVDGSAPTLKELDRDERIKAMQAEIERAMDTMANPDGWRDFLEHASKFHNYSLNNAMLIRWQCPEATRVAGFNTWKQHGRTVKKGESAIFILAPIVKKFEDAENPDDPSASRVVGFRTAAVFDVSQTEGDPLPEPPAIPRSDLDDGSAPDGMVEDLQSRIDGLGFSVSYRKLPEGTGGYTSFGTNEVVISDSRNRREQARTLAHEAAHIALGHGDRVAEYHSGFADARPDMEVEAESVAYIVSRHWGLDEVGGASFNYIDSWALGDAERVKRTATAVLKGARALLAE